MIRALGLALALTGCLPTFDTAGCLEPEECPVHFRCESRRCVPLPDAAPVDLGVDLGVDLATPDAAPGGDLESVLLDDRFGNSIAVLGDINADGYADIALGAPLTTLGVCVGQCGRVYVYQGSAAGLQRRPAAVIDAPPELDRRFGLLVLGAGDTDKDGFDNLAVTSREGPVFVFAGSIDGIASGRADHIAQSILPPPPDLLQHGRSVAAGDLNGDGHADLAIGSENHEATISCPDGPTTIYVGRQRTTVYFGSKDGLDQGRPAQRLEGIADRETLCGCASLGEGHRRCDLGTSLLASADIQGDGIADLLIGSAGPQTDRGVLHLHGGGTEGPTPLPIDTQAGTCAGERLGSTPQLESFGVQSLGDLDADGHDDLGATIRPIHAACAERATSDQILLIRGAAGGLGASRVLLSMPSPVDGPGVIDNFVVERLGRGPALRIYALTLRFRASAEAPIHSRIWRFDLDGSRAGPPILVAESLPEEQFGPALVVYRAHPLAPTSLLTVVKPLDSEGRTSDTGWVVRQLPLGSEIR